MTLREYVLIGVLLLFAAAAATAFVVAVYRMTVHGEVLRVESEWGGLGQGFGGWQVSTPAALLLFAALFTGATIMVGSWFTSASRTAAAQESTQRPAAAPAPAAAK